MTFTAAQFARLNHYAHNQNKRNCQIHESCTTVSKIELVGNKMFANVTSEDVVNGIFRTISIISIGPRGGLTF